MHTAPSTQSDYIPFVHYKLCPDRTHAGIQWIQMSSVNHTDRLHVGGHEIKTLHEFLNDFTQCGVNMLGTLGAVTGSWLGRCLT